MPSQVTMKQLLETGVHFGHRTQKWNPKMAPYIFTQRNGIHILDLQQTIVNLHKYHDMIRDIAARDGTVLFVGTKRQAQDTISREADRCGMPYVNHRWLGGTLTNWRTIRERIDTLKKLEADREAGIHQRMTKREALMRERKIEKLQLRLGGIRDMKRIPEMVIVVDTHREITAVKEANILDIPVLALVDSNSNPDNIDYILPANDDAMRAIKLMVSAMADAVLEGKAMRKEGDFDEAFEATSADAENFMYDDEEDGDEAYLGESTLAKLRDAKLFEDDDENKDEDNAETNEETSTETKGEEANTETVENSEEDKDE